MHWTIIPCSPTSSESAVEKVSMNALVPEYVASMGEGMIPLNEPMLSTNPDFLDPYQQGIIFWATIMTYLLTMPGRTILVIRTVASILIAMISESSEGSDSAKYTGYV